MREKRIPVASEPFIARSTSLRQHERSSSYSTCAGQITIPLNFDPLVTLFGCVRDKSRCPWRNRSLTHNQSKSHVEGDDSHPMSISYIYMWLTIHTGSSILCSILQTVCISVARSTRTFVIGKECSKSDFSFEVRCRGSRKSRAEHIAEQSIVGSLIRLRGAS